MIRLLFRIVILSIGLRQLLPRLSVSYIDPNTGGMLFQLLAVIITAFSATFLFFSRQIRGALASLMRAFRGWFGR
jgi:hypothetical protein